MFSYFKSINIVQKKDYIVIQNIKRLSFLIRDIDKHWKTSKITLNMFKKIGNNYLELHNFYIPDVIYMLENMKKSKKKYYSINTINIVLNKLKEDSVFSNIYSNTNEEVKYNKSLLGGLKFTPKDYQEDFLNVYLTNKNKYHLKGYMLAATAGSGKTATSLMLYTLLCKSKLIIISPLNAINEVWVPHVTDKLFIKHKTYSTSKDVNGLDINNEVLIVHYQYLNEFISKVSNVDLSDSMIIIDESHNFNEISSNRTSLLIDFCIKSKSRDILLMSGTPIKAIPQEAIPLLRCIDDMFIPDVQESFKKVFRQNNNRGSDILANRLGLISFKVQKEELGLLEPIFHTVKVKIPNGDYYTLDKIKERMEEYSHNRKIELEKLLPHAKDLYDFILDKYSKSIGLFNKDMKAEYDLYIIYLKSLYNRNMLYTTNLDIIPYCNRFEVNKLLPLFNTLNPIMAKEWMNNRTIYKYPELKIRGECLGLIVGGARSKCHEDMVEAIDFNMICESSSKKTVVFTSFVNVVEKAIEHLPTIGLNPLAVYSKTNKDLNSIISIFKQNEGANPLVATYKSLSTAVPLVMADNMILIDTPFRDYILQQTVSRIHRLDSDTQTNVWIIELDTGSSFNISQRTKEILEWSQKQIKEIIGINSPFDFDKIDGSNEYMMTLEGFNFDKPKYTEW